LYGGKFTSNQGICEEPQLTTTRLDLVPTAFVPGCQLIVTSGPIYRLWRFVIQFRLRFNSSCQKRLMTGGPEEGVVPAWALAKKGRTSGFGLVSWVCLWAGFDNMIGGLASSSSTGLQESLSPHMRGW
jgi:hypothetical protein